MASPYDVYPIPIGGGLNLTDAEGQRPLGDVAKLLNLRSVGAGRVAPRPWALAVGAAFAGDCVGIFRFPFYKGGTPPIGAIRATWDGAAAVTLTKLGPDGSTGTALAGLPAEWTAGVLERPQISGAVLGTRLFLCGRAGAHKMPLLYYEAVDDLVYIPDFDFDGDYQAVAATGDHGLMYPRCLGVHANILFAAGYGDETDPDRPEVVHYSYLGMDFDPNGVGDAGLTQDPTPTEIAPGSSNLFDREDHFGVGERGRAIRAVRAAMGRLLFLSETGVHHLFGYDRDTFNLEQLDAVRGTSNEASVVEANGTLYWWSAAVGPVVYTGGGVEELGAALRDRIPEVPADRVVGEHLPESHEVRWYYPVEGGGADAPTKSLSWDYRRQKWSENEHPYPVYCAGSLSPVSTDVTAGVIGGSPETPLGVPTGLTVVSTSAYGATVSWTNAEVGLKAQVEVWLAGRLVATLDVNGAATSSYTFAKLAPQSTYDWWVRHRILDRVGDSALSSLTTPPDTTAPPPPTSLKAEKWPSGGVYLSWRMADSGAETDVQRRVVGDEWPVEVLHTLEPGETFWLDETADWASTDYEYRIRHVYRPTAGGLRTPSPWSAGVTPSSFVSVWRPPPLPPGLFGG